METNERKQRGIEPELVRVLNLATRNLLAAQTAINSGSLETAQTAIDSAGEFMTQVMNKLTRNGNGSNGHAPREPEPPSPLPASLWTQAEKAQTAPVEQVAFAPAKPKKAAPKKNAPKGTYSNIVREYLASHAGPFRVKDVVLWAKEKKQQLVDDRAVSSSLGYLAKHKHVLRKQAGVFQRPKTA
jgi:hypothetical protein